MNDKAISVVLPDDLKKKLDEFSRRKNISRNALIRLILTEYLEKES